MNTEVLIVGAGPSGLSAAALLAHLGVPFRIIDKENGPTEQSRALIVHARTLELFDKLSLAESVLAQGQQAEGINFLIGGRHAGGLKFADAGEERTPYPYALVLEQSKTERALLGHIEAQGHRVDWQTELLNLTQDQNGTTAQLRREGKTETVHAAWVIGADGASSAVRKSLGLGFSGGTYERMYYLADTKLTWPFKYDQLYINLTAAGFTGFFPMYGDGRFRVFGPATTNMEDAQVEFDEVRDIVESHSNLDVKLSDPGWVAQYKIHHRMAEHFRQGRIFLVGDAAHIHSPAGGQGMNTGIQDAWNLAWKVALVAKGQAHAELLDSYEPERIPVAKEVLSGTDKLFSAATSGGALARWFRLHLMGRIFNFVSSLPLTRALAFKKVSQIGITYRGSPAVAAQGGRRNAVMPGDRAPYAHVNGKSLFSLLKGCDHHLLVFGEQKDVAKLEAVLESYPLPIQTHLLEKNDVERKSESSVYCQYRVKDKVTFLIRPDGYIAFKGEGIDAEGLNTYLNTLFVRRMVAQKTQEVVMGAA